MEMTKDMTKGKPMKLILEFAIPFLFGLLFQQFYSIVDTMIVGKCLGSNALAAVGATGSLNFLIIGFCMGVCTGFAIPVAQYFGAGDEHQLRKAVGNSAWLSILFSVVMSAATVILCKQFLIWMRTPADIMEQSYTYIVIIFAGIPATYLYNLLAGIIRSLGDSRTPVVFLAIASFLNIVLDLILIMGCSMGVSGAALATVISQAVSGVLCLFYMRRKYAILKMSREEWKWDRDVVRKLCGMGIPMGLQYSVTAIGSVILQSSVNMLGTMSVAAITAGSKVSIFFCCPYEALGSTMATYGGQNVGAGKLDRIGKGLRAAIGLGFAYSIVALFILVGCGKELTLLFLNKGDGQIIAMSYTFLLWNAGAYCLLVLVNTVRFLIQGLGFSVYAIFAGLFEMIARTLVAFLFVPMLGYTGACMASPLAWLFADLFLIPAYFRCMRILKKNISPAAALTEEAHQVEEASFRGQRQESSRNRPSRSKKKHILQHFQYNKA